MTILTNMTNRAAGTTIINFSKNYLLIGDEKQGEGANKQIIGICESFSNSIYVKYCLCEKI